MSERRSRLPKKKTKNLSTAPKLHEEKKQTGTEDNMQESEDYFSKPMAHEVYHESGLDGRSESEDYFSKPMAHEVYHESGLDGRSVLGMLAVQVERDHKTGSTVVRSVAPVSAPDCPPEAATLFDDGRKSIHVVGGPGEEPSTEELGQILNVIDDVGMKVLLDEVAITPHELHANTETEDADKTSEREDVFFSAYDDMSNENNAQQLDGFKSNDFTTEAVSEDCTLNVQNEESKAEEEVLEATNTVDDEVKEEHQNLEEEPVTLVFLGYADADASAGQNEDAPADQEEPEGMLTAQRVFITDDGEEHLIEPESNVDNVAVVEESKSEVQSEVKNEVFQDVPLEGNGTTVKVEEGNDNKEISEPSPPEETTEGEVTSKRKTCQCCSVM